MKGASLCMLRFQYFIVVIIAQVLLSSCSEKLVDGRNKMVLNYNEMNGLSSLDPAAASNFENISIVHQLFNGLMQMDDQLNILPCIAKSYQISEDGKTYTFSLRTDVHFHDDPCFTNGKGREVIANDFRYSFIRLFDSKVSSAGSLTELIEMPDGPSSAGINAPNDSTLVIHLKKSFSAFLNILTMKYFSVLPQEAIEKYQQNFRNHPVGTGPFIFKMWEEGTKLILHKNPNYFEKDEHGEALPYLDAVTVSFIRDRESAFMELLNGKFDLLSGADAFNPNEVLDKEGRLRDLYQKKFVLQKSTFLKTDYIGILVDEQLPIVKESPLKIRAIRQAINYGFDRRKLIRYLRNSLGIAAEAGFIPPGLKSFDTTAVKGYYYNPSKTAQLLTSAGYPGGKGLPEIILHTTDNYKEQVEFIQAELAKNNIRTQISVEKPSVLRQAVNRGEYLLFRKSWVADYSDEENFMSLFYSKNFTPKGINFFHYSNPQFDALYEKVLTVNDLTEKKKIYQKMDQMVCDDAPVITLFYDQVVRLVSHSISGLETNPMNLLELRKVRKQN